MEQICWAGERLFSVSLSGNGLIEYDINTLKIKKNLLLTGDKGICIDFHQKTQRLAIGTEEGFINIFDIRDDDAQFVKVLDRQDHRVVCCMFNDLGDCIVSGSLDAVKIWSVRTGHVIHKMSTGRADQNQETIVWCVEVLKDFTILTGDSRGRVTFWDGNLGTQIDWVQASNFDIMCLTMSEDQNTFYCSGSEQIVRKYVRIKTNRDDTEVEQWIRTAKRYKLHTHDILSLVRMNEKIISGGVDGFLSISSSDLKILERIGPFLKHPFAVTAENSRMMLMTYTNYLELWKLATPKEEIDRKPDSAENEEDFDTENDDIKPLDTAKKYFKMERYPEKYLELRSKQDEMITCSSISNNGKWISYSTNTAIRFFHFEEIEGSKPQLTRVKNLPIELKCCTHMIFSEDSNTFVTVAENICTIFDLSSDLIEHRQTIDLSERHKDLVHLFEMSCCSKYLVFSSMCNTISIWSLKKGKYNFSGNLPKHSYPTVAMKIRPHRPELVISYADNRIVEYDMDEFFIKFTLTLEEPNFAVQDICLGPEYYDTIVFTHNNSIMVVRKGEEQEEISSKKLKRSTKHYSAYSIKTIKKFQNVSIQI